MDPFSAGGAQMITPGAATTASSQGLQGAFPPVITGGLLKRPDPASQTMYKGGNPANPSNNNNTLGSREITKRPFSNINLVVPAAYPQTTVQQLICQ